MGNKSIYIAYLLLIIGGFVGLHLLYLHRDRQAFLYWCTFGGYLGLGPLRDLFLLTTYVKDYNNDSEYTAALVKKIKRNRKPPFSVSRFAAQIVIGNSWSFLWMSAVPDIEIFSIPLRFIRYFAPFLAALAVWLVGNIGREKGSFSWAIIGSAYSLPLIILDTSYINFSSVTSAVVFTLKGSQWRRTPYQDTNFCKRFMYLSFGWLLFCSIWSVYFLFNTEVAYANGEKVKLKDAFYNFFKSPMFLEFKKNLWKLFEDIRLYGWSEAFKNLIELIDPLGEIHALKVLNLPKNATQEEISATFRKLSREWHPDRHKDQLKKEEAHERFIEISQAYEVLSLIKKRRSNINKRTDDDYNIHNV